MNIEIKISKKPVDYQKAIEELSKEPCKFIVKKKVN
jgi:hypothetical protein